MSRKATRERSPMDPGYPITREDVPTVDPLPGNYYVSVRDAGRTGLLLGPFRAHREAIDRVSLARCLAEEVDPFAAFFHFGTVKMAETFTRPGRLNELAKTSTRCKR